MENKNLIKTTTKEGRQLIIRKEPGNLNLGLRPWFCGYVQMLPTDVFYGDGYSQSLDYIDFDVRYPEISKYAIGGVTYIGNVPEAEDNHKIFIGFDTARPNRAYHPTVFEVAEAVVEMVHAIKRFNEAER